MHQTKLSDILDQRLVELDSDDTDFSEEEIVIAEEEIDIPPEILPPPVVEEPPQIVTYSNAKYFKKKRTVITEIVNNKGRRLNSNLFTCSLQN